MENHLTVEMIKLQGLNTQTHWIWIDRKNVVVTVNMEVAYKIPLKSHLGFS